MKMEAKLKLKNNVPLKVSILLLFPLLLTSCDINDKFTSIYSFDTLISFQYNHSRDMEDAFCDAATTLSNLCDGYQHKNNITNLFDLNASEVPLTLEDDLVDIIKTGLYYEQETDGMFSLLIKDLADAYKEFYLDYYYYPEGTLLDPTPYLDDIRDTSIEINDKEVFVNGPSSIDLGGIAKGYFLENKVKPMLEEKNIKDYIINAGNSSILLGKNNKRKGLYNVGLNYSNYYVKLSQCAIGTSSIYEQNFISDSNNNVYSHVINPKNGSSKVVNDVCICISNDACLCDVLSTVGIISSIEEIKAFETKFDVSFITFSNFRLTYCNPKLTLLER